MKRGKYLLTLTAALCGLFALVLTAEAAGQEPVTGIKPTVEVSGTVDLFQCGSLTGHETRPGEAVLFGDTIEQQIYEGLLAQQESITIVRKDLAITQNNLNELCQLVVDSYEKVVNDNPRLFYVTGGYHMSGGGNSATGLYVTLTPSYQASVTADQITAFDLAVEEAKAQVSGITDDVEKALILHDYLVVQNAYNREVSTTGTCEDPLAWSAYAALVQGNPVCQGYTLAYKLLLNEVGIQCITVSSSAMTHMWNMVQLDGSWYHVDVTWDDPTPNIEGCCKHAYFLLSDHTISGDHYGWDASGVTCDSASYESGYIFNDTATAVHVWNGNFYYIVSNSGNTGTLYCAQSLQGGGQAITQLTELWHPSAVWLKDNLYYAAQTFTFPVGAYCLQIKRCDLNSGETYAVGEPISDIRSPSQDGFYTSNNDFVGLRLNADGTTIEAVSSTRQTVLVSVEVADYPIAWGKLTLANTEQAKLAGLYQSDGGTLKAGVLLGSGVSGEKILWAAFYKDGRLVAVRQTVFTAESGLQVLNLGSALLPPWDEVRVFLAEESLAPLCGAWRGMCSGL